MGPYTRSLGERTSVSYLQRAFVSGSFCQAPTLKCDETSYLANKKMLNNLDLKKVQI